MEDAAKDETALACRHEALGAAEKARHQELLRDLMTSVRERQESPDGYGFRLPPDAFLKAAEWITLERRCCPFLRFGLDWAEGESAPWLRLGGREGVKEFLVRVAAGEGAALSLKGAAP